MYAENQARLANQQKAEEREEKRRKTCAVRLYWTDAMQIQKMIEIGEKMKHVNRLTERSEIERETYGRG